MQDVTNPVSLPSFYCMYDILSSWTLCNKFHPIIMTSVNATPHL
jgi:hypothetical protein